MNLRISFRAELWVYPGDAAWYFITLPIKNSKEIKSLQSTFRKGFGSVKVEAKIDNTKWNTSIFPDSRRDSYLLPIKKQVRQINNLEAGDKVEVSLKILES